MKCKKEKNKAGRGCGAPQVLPGQEQRCGPHTNNFDFTILKRINITESQSFEFQAQMLNLFNHAQYLPGYISDVQPGVNGYTANSIFAMLVPDSPTFNQPKSVFTNHPRQMVLVLKYNF